MSLSRTAEWLRCPFCFGALSETGPLTLGCAQGHRFDANKRGYVNLLGVQTGHGKGAPDGDTAAMLEDRKTFLSAGHYSPIVAELEALAVLARPRRIIDAGCGTGHYLSAVHQATDAPDALAVDASVPAVTVTVRDALTTAAGALSADTSAPARHTAGLVADLWHPLPIKDASADLLLNIFAPRNPAEFHRVLTPGGSILTVLPRVNHLQELQDSGYALEVPDGKLGRLADQFAGRFTLAQSAPLQFSVELSEVDARRLAGMGPAGHHHRETDAALPSTITVAVDVLQFVRIEP